MAKQTVNIGSSVNDGTGDPLRAAFEQVNQNFDELYLGGLAESDLEVQTDTISNSVTDGDIVISPNGTGTVQVVSKISAVDPDPADADLQQLVTLNYFNNNTSSEYVMPMADSSGTYLTAAAIPDNASSVRLEYTYTIDQQSDLLLPLNTSARQNITILIDMGAPNSVPNRSTTFFLDQTNGPAFFDDGVALAAVTDGSSIKCTNHRTGWICHIEHLFVFS